eukprot:symbB.v1.2.007831.t2/scaffold463.1/size291460/12
MREPQILSSAKVFLFKATETNHVQNIAGVNIPPKKDLSTAGWSNVDTLSRLLFPDSRNTNPGKKAPQVKGEAKGWRSANRLVELRDTTKRGYSSEGEFYREAPIFVSAEESVRGLHLDAVQVVFILGLPKTASSYVHMVSLPPWESAPPAAMGAKPCICVLRAEIDCRPPVRDRWSCCGSDAFYRDEFLEEEAVPPKASLTGLVCEQARLKSMKGLVFLDYTTFSAKQAASAFKRRFSGEILEEEILGPLTPLSPSSPTSPYNRSFSDWTRLSNWVGKTMKEWKKPGLPPNRGAHWKKGDGEGLQVRSGPDYAKRRQHVMTAPGHLFPGILARCACWSSWCLRQLSELQELQVFLMNGLIITKTRMLKCGN